jgi:hypothetical protein
MVSLENSAKIILHNLAFHIVFADCGVQHNNIEITTLSSGMLSFFSFIPFFQAFLAFQHFDLAGTIYQSLLILTSE